jgi:cyclase
MKLPLSHPRLGARRRLRAGAWALALLAAAPCALAAQGEARDATARLERVGDGAYVIIHDDATDDWPHGNTGVIVGDEGVLVVDATYLPSRARADIALIRRVTPKPVRYLVYTHWHFDHNNGGIAYREAFPGVTIVSERETAGYIVLNGTWWARMSVAPGSPRQALLAGLQAELASGRDTAGAPLAAEARARLEKAVRQRQAEMVELRTLEVVPPDLRFDRQLTLRLGKRRVELVDRGRANSPHDVTVWLPDDRILFTGDLVVQSPLPYLLASWPVPWIEVLKDIEAVPAAALVPGHGPVMHDPTYIRQVRALLEAATSRVTALALEGKTLDQIQDTLDLDDIRRATPVWRDPALDGDWKASIRMLIERAWRGVRGQG